MATHPSVLAWRIPGTGKPDGLLLMGSHRVGHDWSDLAAASDTASTPALLPGESHRRRSLAGCSPCGHEESDTTERLHFHFSLSCTGEGNGNPLQSSCLENPRDRGAWWAAVYGVAQSRTQLKWLSSSSRHRLTLWCLIQGLFHSLCDPMDCGSPSSSFQGILQARILEWVAILFSRGSSPPRDWTRGLLHCWHLLITFVFLIEYNSHAIQFLLYKCTFSCF